MSIKAEASANLIFYSVPEMFWDFWQPKYLKAGDTLEKVCHTHPPLQPQHFVAWHKGEKEDFWIQEDFWFLEARQKEGYLILCLQLHLPMQL